MSKSLLVETDKEAVEMLWTRAKAVKTPTELTDFVESLIYNYDYGTIVHAVMAAALAAANCINRSKVGGLTGFQAGCGMWLFIRRWTDDPSEGAMRLIKFDKLLYPQNKDDFGLTIPKGAWERVQALAKKKLAKAQEEGHAAESVVVAHWKRLAAGKVPFNLTVSKEN